MEGGQEMPRTQQAAETRDVSQALSNCRVAGCTASKTQEVRGHGEATQHTRAHLRLHRRRLRGSDHDHGTSTPAAGVCQDGALLSLWPTALSYLISYVFVAIVWINHHFVIGYIKQTTLRVIWLNFIHLFFVSLLPFATAWIASTELARAPVVVYTSLCVVTDGAYNLFEREVLGNSGDFSAAELEPAAEVADRAGPVRCWVRRSHPAGGRTGIHRLGALASPAARRGP